MSVIHADRERCPLRLGVGDHHERKVELISTLWLERDADHPRGVGQEECDVLRRSGLCRHDEIAFVLAVFIIDHDHDLLLCDRLDRFINR